jgi:succinoglycan biosynthesis transport protein ExoP
MEKDSIKLNDVMDVFRRRWPVLAAVFLVVVLGAIAISYSLDDLYASTGVIDIEKSDTYVDKDSGENLELRIYRVNDDVMTRENLAALVEKHNLYPELRGDESPLSVVWLVRENTQLKVIRKESEANSRDVGPVVGFSVSYFHEVPLVARNVARDLQTLFLEANDSRTLRAIDSNLAVLYEEKEQIQQNLNALEDELVGFKNRYPGAMPEDLRRVQQQIDRKADELVRVEEDIRTLRADLDRLRIGLRNIEPYLTVGPGGTSGDQLEALKIEYIRLIGLYGEDHPDVRRVRRQLEAMMGPDSSFAIRQLLEQQLAKERESYDELVPRTGPEHPDRLAAERRIRELEEQLEELPRQQSRPPDNPAYIDQQLRIDATGRELAAQRARRTDVIGDIEDLEAKINVAPEVARELTALLREIGIVENTYKNIQQRIVQLEKERREEISPEQTEWYWEVKKEPRLPYLPVYPNRPLYIVLAVFLGLTLGLGASLAREALDGTIRGTRDVRHVMQMPPIAAIPQIKTSTDVRRDRIRHVAIATSVVLAIGAVGLYVRLQTTGVI